MVVSEVAAPASWIKTPGPEQLAATARVARMTRTAASSARPAWGWGLATTTAAGDVLDVWYPEPELGAASSSGHTVLSGDEVPAELEGSAREAAKGFPANLNVAVALSLAGIGPDRTVLEVWADPAATRNQHRIEVDADSASFSMARPECTRFTSRTALPS